MEISNVHDKYFKQTFANKDNMKHLIINSVPEEVVKHIDIDNIEIDNTNMVDDEYKESYSDILVRTTIHGSHNCYIYFLYDHKSYRDKFTQFQLLKYMIKIWDKEISNFTRSNKPLSENNLSLIIPVIFYHGKDSWNYKTDFSIYFDERVFNKYISYIPSFDAELYNLLNVDDKSIKGSTPFIMSILLFKYIFRNLKEHIKDIFDYLELSDNLDYNTRIILKTLILYILSSTDDLTPEYLISEIEDKTLKEVIMSVKEQIEKKAREEGRQEGRQEGERVKAIDTAKEMKSDGVSIEIISKYTGLSEKEIEEL